MARTEEDVITSFMSSSSVLNPACREHVMQLYHAEEEHNAAGVEYINEGLKKDYLCVYASVGVYDSVSKWYYSNLSSNIENFDENVKQGNLVIMDFKSLFEAARKGDPALFNQLKIQLGLMLKQHIANGKGDKLLVFADAACTLLENNESEGCLKLERWWQSTHKVWAANHQNVTIICPQPAAVFNEEDTTAAHAKAQISVLHSVVLQARRHYQKQQRPQTAVAGPINRVLIAESEQDIRVFYRTYLNSITSEVIIVPDAAKCFEYVFDTKDNKGFDIVILDTHLEDMSGIVVARQIKQRLPDQRIVITTTTTSADEIERVGVSRDDILYKPFSPSKLLGLIKPEK